MEFFGASIQVIALIIGIACIISAILNRAFGIGPVQIPAPRDLWPRAGVGTLGIILLLIANWSNVFGGQTLFQILGAPFVTHDDPQFGVDNKSLADMLSSRKASAADVGVKAEAVYSEAPTSKRCLVIREIRHVFPDTITAYPGGAIHDAAKYRKGTADTRFLIDCDAELMAILALSDALTQGAVAFAPTERPASAGSQTVVTRPTPSIATQGNVTAETIRRVLTASTLRDDEGWIFIGVRDRYHPVLINDRRIAVRNIPRNGVVVMIADSELLETDNPGKSLGTIKGYVRAGSAVQVREIAGPRHYTDGEWDGYDVYARVTIQSTPQHEAAAASVAATQVATPIAAATAPLSARTPSASLAIAACAALPTASTTTFTYCNETYPKQFGAFKLQSYKVTDTHSTGIHFRSIGSHVVYLSIFPGCDAPALCPAVKGAALPPATAEHDATNDYIYTANTLKPFNYGWVVELSAPQAE